MSAYIITNSELVAIANAIREKLSSDNIFTLDDMPTAIANIGTITGSGATVAVGNNTKYLINETKLTAIADAVRLKNGSSTQYLLSELPQAILDIELEEPTPPVGLIEDSWETIISKINSGKAKYQVGSYKPLDLGSKGIVNMQIVGKNTSPLASGSGTATYDWLSMELLKTNHRMNASDTTEGGWGASEMRTYLKGTIKPLIPENVRNAIKSVTKYSRIYQNGSAVNDVASTEDVWIPSMREIFGGTSYETEGPVYAEIFPDKTSRKKTKAGASSASWWWLRSAYTNGSFYGVYSSGSLSNGGASTTGALALGFSI